MSAPKMPRMPPMRPGGPPGPGAMPTDEQLAYAMQQARAQMVIATMNAAREQMHFEVTSGRLLFNLDAPEQRVLQAGMAVAAVTGAQILTDKVIDAFAKRLEIANGRITALEAALAGHEKAAEHVAALAKRLEEAIASFTGAPPLTADESAQVREGIAALGEGADDASEAARR